MEIPNDIKDLSIQETAQYIYMFLHEGDESKRDYAGVMLFQSYYRYIVHLINRIAPSYYPQYHEDLISECTVCFFEKLAGYDPQKGYKLTTYLTPHLTHVVTEYINRLQNNSAYYNMQIRRIKACIDEIDEKGESYTAEVISNKTGISLSTVKKCFNMMDVAEIYYSSNEFLEESISRTQSSPEEQMIIQLELENIHKALKILTPEEYEIVSLFYGFDQNGVRKSMTKISLEKKMPIKSVRRIKSKAINKLRNAIKKEGVFADEAIKREIDAANEAFTFIPRGDEALQDFIKMAEEIDIDF